MYDRKIKTNRRSSTDTQKLLSRKLSERVWLLLVAASHHRTVAGFDTDFNCNEIKQSTEYVNDVKSFVADTADHFNQRHTPHLDLSTLGLGFVADWSFLSHNYQHFLSLDLSKNVISKIDITLLLRFPAVLALDMSKNCLTALDINHRFVFGNLQSLNVSHNRIATVHPFTFSNVSLESVDLSHNQLIRLWVADYEINQMFLNHNRLTQVAIESSHFKELKLLEARNNRIRIFEASVDFEDLILSGNHLTLDEYFAIRNVYGTLDLSRNHISEVSWKIINCVTNLSLAFNRLTSLVCSEKRLQRVERMNLDGNILCNFDQSPNITACLPNLKFISLLNNRLSGASMIKTKAILTSLGVKSQIFDYDFFSPSNDDCKHFGIFRN